MKAIYTQNLTKKYKKKTAIDDVSLSIEEGEIYGFIGPNGAGKSTTIKLLMNFIYPDEGTAEIFGLDSVRDAKKIREMTGYVSSDVRFYPQMNTYQLLETVCDFHQIKNMKKTIDYYIEKFDIDPKKKSAELSLGNKKKIAIVAALLIKPRLLILDEPTNGLDPLMQHRLFEEIEQKNKEGMTIFLSSHDLNEIQQHANSAAFIRQGKIITVQDIQSERSLGKIVQLSGNHLDPRIFKIPGIQLLKQEDNSARLLVNLSKQQLIALISDKSIEDFSVTLPNLEDQFMSLYEGGNQDDSL